MAGPPAPTTMPPGAAGRWAVAALAMAMLLSSLGTSVANVALPSLEEAFDASFGAVQWVVLAYLVTVTALVVSVGRLGDLVGRRRLLLAGIATFTVASALCAAAPALWALVLARALQGVGAAAMMALALASVAGTVPAARTGGAMGLLASTSAIGTAVGPSLGGALIAGLGWRAIFLVNVPLGLLALALAVRALPADRPRPDAARRSHDLPGTLLLALTLGAYALAMTADPGRLTPAGVALLLAALAGAAILAVAERRAPAPLIEPAALRDPVLRAGLTASAVASTVVMATLVVGPFHLARALGLGPAAVGVVMSAGPAVVALAGVPAGRIADRLGARRVTLAGLAGMAAGAVLLALAPTRIGVPGYVGPIAVLTLGYACFQTGNTAAVMAGAPAERRGVISGMLNLSRNLGLITGASLMGAVFTLASGTGGRAEDVAAGTRTTFLLAAALLLAAIAVAAGGGTIRRPRRRRRQRRSSRTASDQIASPISSPASAHAETRSAVGMRASRTVRSRHDEAGPQTARLHGSSAQPEPSAMPATVKTLRMALRARRGSCPCGRTDLIEYVIGRRRVDPEGGSPARGEGRATRHAAPGRARVGPRRPPP